MELDQPKDTEPRRIRSIEGNGLVLGRHFSADSEERECSTDE